jgi:ABC-type bacteriocin/lantibiotic exporter with double-glycine peptidase domain
MEQVLSALKNFRLASSLFFPYLTKNNESKIRSFLMLTTVLLDAAVAVSVPFLFKLIVDNSNGFVLYSPFIIVALFGVFWTLEKGFQHIQEIIFFPVINNAIKEITFRTVKRIHQTSLKDYEELSIPEVISAIKRIGMSIRMFVRGVFFLIPPTILKLIAVSTSIFTKSQIYGASILIMLSVYAAGILFAMHWYTKNRILAWKISDKVTVSISDSILNTRKVRFNLEDEMKQLDNMLEKEASQWLFANTRLHGINLFVVCLTGIISTGLIYHAVKLLQSGLISAGDLVMLQGQITAAFIPLAAVALKIRPVIESTIDINRIVKILSLPEESREYSSSKTTYKQTGWQLTNVSFFHQRGSHIFTDLNLKINEGEKIALIGESGSGKSTLSHLLVSLIKPTSGSISFRGKNISYFSRHELGKIIHFVPQDIYLKNSSLYLNITHGINNIKKMDLDLACSLTGIDKIYKREPAGINFEVGELGSKLSGGERQRVALTRAILAKPEILILDETNSSLNVAQEKDLFEKIFSLIPTVIVVSHRKSILELTNRTIVVNNCSQAYEAPEPHFSDYSSRTRLNQQQPDQRRRL